MPLALTANPSSSALRLASVLARHVVTENERVLTAVEMLEQGRMEGFGALMTASHASLRHDFAVSVPETDLPAVIDAYRRGNRPPVEAWDRADLAYIASLVDEAIRDRFLAAGQGGYYVESSVLQDGITRGHFHTACRMLSSTSGSIAMPVSTRLDRQGEAGSSATSPRPR